MAGPETTRRFLPRSSRELFLAVAWCAVVFAVFSPFVKEWDRDEWVHHAITGLILVPLAIVLVRLYKGEGPDHPVDSAPPES